MLCKHHFTTLSTCWSGFEEWWQRSGKLLTGSPGVGCCPGGWPGVRDDNSNYRGTGGCSSVPLTGDQNIVLFFDLVMKYSLGVSRSSEIVLGSGPDWKMPLGQDQKSCWCDKGRLQMRENSPLLSWFHTSWENTPWVFRTKQNWLIFRRNDQELLFSDIPFISDFIKLFHYNRNKISKGMDLTA